MILNSLFGGNDSSPLTPPYPGGTPGPPFYFVWLHTRFAKEEELIVWLNTRFAKEDELIVWLHTRIAKLFSNIIYIKGGGVRGNLGSPEKVNLKSSQSYIIYNIKNGSF